MEISLLTNKCTLIPSQFFEQSSARETLARVCRLHDDDSVASVDVPQYGAVLVFCDRCDDTVAKYIIDNGNSAGQTLARPDLYYVLKGLPECPEYNKILCSWKEGVLSLAIAQGKSLLLANVWQAADFTTAAYYIFLAMKSLQLNPEVSTICWMGRLSLDEEMSLYRYFKSVETARQ